LQNEIYDATIKLLPSLFKQANDPQFSKTQLSSEMNCQINHVAVLFAQLFNLEIPDAKSINYEKLWKVIERKIDNHPQ